jgi:hypothetical protein
MKRRFARALPYIGVSLLFLAGLGKILRPVTDEMRRDKEITEEQISLGESHVDNNILDHIQNALVDWAYFSDGYWHAMKLIILEKNLCVVSAVNDELSSVISIASSPDNREAGEILEILINTNNASWHHNMGWSNYLFEIDEYKIRIPIKATFELALFSSIVNIYSDNSFATRSSLIDIRKTADFMNNLKKGNNLQITLQNDTSQFIAADFSLSGSRRSILAYEACLNGYRPDDAISREKPISILDFMDFTK